MPGLRQDTAGALFVTGLALTSLTLCAQTADTITGRVTNSVTGEAVGGAKVRFLDRQSHVYSTVTDSTGSYRLAGLDDGEYQGEFTRDGFSESSRNPFSRVSGMVPLRVDAQLDPWAVLRGRVVDEDAKPVSGVRVEINPNPHLSVDPHAETDQNGEFVFEALAPGSYSVVAKPAAKIRMQDGVRLGTVAIYYPSATEPSQATRLPVRTGQNVSGIEIRLKSVPVHRVAGLVLNEAGKPAAHATVKLMGRASSTARQGLGSWMIMPPMTAGPDGTMHVMPGTFTFTPDIGVIVGPGPAPEVASVESRDDGTFEFPAVEQGDWRLSAEAGVDEDMPLGGVASAAVSEQDVEDIRIRLAASFPVEVAVDGGSAQAPAFAELGANILGLSSVEGQPSPIVDDPAGNRRRLNNVFPGRYRVMPGIVQADFYVAAVMWGGRDVNGEVVELAPGAASFQVILKPVGKVRGTVEQGEGASVFLISRNSGETLRYRQVACRAGGAFEIGQVPPGDYYVVAFDRTEKGGLPAADLPGVIVPLASNVRVEAGSTASVDLKVARWPW